MGRIQRLIAPRVRANVNLQDPNAAKVPLAIGQVLLDTVSVIDNISKERAAARRVSEATRLSTQARIEMDKWSAAQEPYDAEGNPRFESVGGDFESQFAVTMKATLDQSDDSKVRGAVERSLLTYKESATGDWLVQSQKWETGHALGEYNAAMIALQTDALNNPERAKDASAQALALSGEMVRVGYMNGAAAQNRFSQFSNELVVGQFRNRVEAGDISSAGRIIQAAKTMPGFSTDEVRAMKSELVVAQNAEYARQEKANNRRQEKTSLSLLVSPAPVEQRLQLLDDAANFGAIFDAGEYRAIKSSLEKEAAPTDDPAVVKYFWETYARQGVTTQDLANAKAKVTAETFTSMSRAVKTSQDSKQIFERPDVKDARSFINDRLRQSGRAASKMTFVETHYIPNAEAELVFAAARLQREGNLTWPTLHEEAEKIAYRYERTITGADRGPAFTPKFRTEEDIMEAYKAGDFGEIGSGAAKSELRSNLQQTNLWIQKKELDERAAQAKGASQSTSGTLPKGL